MQVTAHNAQEALINLISECVYDPLRFVRLCFPWQEPGTALNAEAGPDDWQAKVLEDIGREGGRNDLDGAIRIATRSGHGIGKTALISWIILWFMSTRPFPAIVVTANTKEQLTNKTWRELAKWHRLLINGYWFKWTATKFYHVDYPDTWFASAIPWSKDRSEAFAGTHEAHVLMIFDEASAIDEVIWEVAEGAMTTVGAMWIAFGNPTRNTGRFFECFSKYRHRWIGHQVDSREAKKADKKQIAQWEADYGEDSDFFRVRVKGEAPRSGFRQLISSDHIELASTRQFNSDSYRHSSVLFGVDVADFGDDMSVIAVRQGLQMLDLKKHRPRTMDAQWTMTFASLIKQEMVKYDPDAVFIDATGLGLGVADRLIQLGEGARVHKIYVGGSATKKKQYFNKRAEVWGEMGEWIVDGAIVNDVDLKSDLGAPEYGFSSNERLQLEKKSDMKKRGLASPDCGDALALTFSVPIRKRSAVRLGTPSVSFKKEYDIWHLLKD